MEMLESGEQTPSWSLQVDAGVVVVGLKEQVAILTQGRRAEGEMGNFRSLNRLSNMEGV